MIAATPVKPRFRRPTETPLRYMRWKQGKYHIQPMRGYDVSECGLGGRCLQFAQPTAEEDVCRKCARSWDRRQADRREEEV